MTEQSRSTPAFVVVCGLPGVGKTSVAEAITDRVDGTRLRTDVIRKELFDDPAYTDAETETVYTELFDRARDRVAAGESVVLDATFRTEDFRDRARAAATDTDADCTVVKVECDDDVVRDRIRARTDDESDADVAIYEQFRERFESMTGDFVVVDNSGTQAETRTRVRNLF